jgi:hypothetical protein
MKSILLEIVLSLGAIAFWTFALPFAALFFVFATAWKKTATLLVGEPIAPTSRMSRAAA